MAVRPLLLSLLLLLTVAGRADAGELYVLAVNWQPAFCETRPEKPECLSQTDDRFDASNFALHGLWPEPRDNIYCGVDPAQRQIDELGRWEALPALGLSEQTRSALDRAMPGTASFLDRHEWIKHGTCHTRTPSAETYYRDSLRLLEELNASTVRDLFAENIGHVLSAGEIRRRFDEAFGKGAGRRVHVACRRVGARRLINELTIRLAGPITPERDFGTLLAEAPEAHLGCRAGIVDRVGTGLADPDGASVPISPTR